MPGRWPTLQISLRRKLLALVLLPLLLVIPAILLLTIQWGSSFTAQQLRLRVNADLSVARDAFQRRQAAGLDALSRLADSHRFRARFDSGDRAAAEALAQGLVRSGGFAYVHLTDPEGRLFAGSGELPDTPLQARALAGVPAAGVVVFPPESLSALDPGLPRRAQLSPPERGPVHRAMLLRMVQPVTDGRGQVVALLDGGVLLNGNAALVDGIRNLVYGTGSLPAGSIGSVSLLLDDLRIATTVERSPGVRATGSHASAEVAHQLLAQGGPWSARAFVVNDWYLCAYQPLVDAAGRRVGALQVGFLERPFAVAEQDALAVLLLIFGAILVASAWVAVAGARTIFKPIETMTAVVRATRAGLQARIGPTDRQDELGELAHQFDALLVQLEARNREVQAAADELESKVDQRTLQLSAKNRELTHTIQILKETRRQLIAAEKFAAVGKLSAGIAHEINNPAAILLGNLDLLVQELGDAAEPVRGEITLIYDQLDRISTLVKNLLQYARPPEYVGQTERADLAEVLRRTELLSRHLARKSHVTLKLALEARNAVRVNPSELQQVLMNLVINAIQAMADGGTVALTTEDGADGEAGGVVVRVRDDGPGILPAHLDKVFDPFFTTRTQEGGTGLGLSISYSLIQRNGGRISVSSEPGQGTEFRIWLPPEPRPPEAGEGLLSPFV